MIAELRNKIVELSYKYEFQKELKNNSGFEDSVFQNKMHGVGFSKGESWCSYFAELIWSEAYGNFDSTVINRLQKLFSANAFKTWENFKNSKDFKVKSRQELEPGDLVVWAYYKNGKPKMINEWTLGHIGVVTKVAQLFFLSMEGNTNSKGGREGVEVAEKKRYYDFEKDNGLRLIGFIKPKEV